MDLAVACKPVGTTPSTNGALDPLDKIQTSCLFERTRFDVFEEVADLFVKPKNDVSGASKCAVL